MKKKLLFALMSIFACSMSFGAVQKLDAGRDQNVYYPQVIQLKGKSQNVFYYSWETNGSGVFADKNSLKTKYTPSDEDVRKGFIKIVLISKNRLVSDTVNIRIRAVLAGPDQTILAGEQALVKGSKINVQYFSWETSGSGTFANKYSLETKYTPSIDDIEEGSVKLILVNGNRLTSDTLNLSIRSCSTVDIGNDIIVCANRGGGSIYLEATTYDSAATITWGTTNGEVYKFDNLNSFTTYYYYEAYDIDATPFLEIYAIISNSNGCYDSDTLIVNLQAAPSLEFPEPYVQQYGTDPVYASVYLYGYASGGTWTTSGSGVFAEPNSTYSAYYPSADDARNGCVELTFTSNDPEGPCGPTSGSMTACFNPPCPEVNLGPDFAVCGYRTDGANSIYFEATTSDYAEGITWTTNGTGEFVSPESFATDYLYSNADVDQAFIEIYATISSYGCYDTDTLVVNLQAAPDLVFPEPYVYSCTGGVVYANVYLYGYASSGTWTTSGSGTFDDPTSTYTAYTPGVNDVGNFILTFTSNDPQGPCGAISGYMEANFEECSVDPSSTNFQNSVENVTLYPNPAQDKISINTTTGVTIDKSTTYIIDLFGNRVNFNWIGNDLDISNLPLGQYILHTISSKGKVYVLRFTKK